MDLFKRAFARKLLLFWLMMVSGGHSFLIRNVPLQKCIHASSNEAERVGFSDCKQHSPWHQWSWDGATWALVNQETRECLTVSKAEELAVAHLETCKDEAHQAWVCSKKGHLTLPGSALHLRVKEDGDVAFLSPKKGRFSKWKTETGTLVCAREMARTPEASEPMDTSLDTLEGEPKSQMATSLEIYASSANAATFLMTSLESPFNVTSGLPNPKHETKHLKTDEEKYPPLQKHQEKVTDLQYPGISWKTVVLVLSLLAFILGVIVLRLSIHSQKKKRLLTLKSRQMSCEEHLASPQMGRTGSKQQMIPASPSPLLKRGEILIEWKNGTVTPLFDSSTHQTC